MSLQRMRRVGWALFFPKYGHWIHMTDPAYKSVVCSFYKMPNGNYWMNQNFGG
ncbi:MAG: hypothetical protein RL701_238 [Pseudomonadota bacterium]|jgi:hypothetical protein